MDHDKRAFSVRASINIVCHHVSYMYIDIKIRATRCSLRTVTACCFVVMDEAAEEVTRGMRNTRRLIGSVKHEGQSEKADRSTVWLSVYLAYQMQMDHSEHGGSARARSRYYVRSRIDSKVVWTRGASLATLSSSSSPNTCLLRRSSYNRCFGIRINFNIIVAKIIEQNSGISGFWY